MIYQYKCENDHILEENQSISAKREDLKNGRIIICNECGKEMEAYLDSPPLGFPRGEANTVGQVGERNFKKLGKVKGQEMLIKNAEHKKKAEKELLRQKGVDADSLPDYKHLRRLANLTPKQQEKYIHEGKLPPGK